MDYKIEYTVKGKNNSILKKNGITIVKNKSNSIEAQVEFEKFLKRKYKDFQQLIVHKCDKENSQINSMFGDIFKDNPFGKGFDKNNPFSGFGDIFNKS